MLSQKKGLYKVILTIAGITVLVMGIMLFLIPPAVSCDPSQAFQVLRCMQLGGGFNNLVSPDQGDIAKTYTQFFTWWSPGQYLIPYFFELITGLNMGRAIAITVTIAELCGLVGCYYFFKKIGFTQNVAAISLVFIICQQAFMIPNVYYNGGEILLFSFEGCFLYGCIALKKPGLKLVSFVLLSAFIGFFLKSSFLWMYGAGLCCLWLRLSGNRNDIADWLKKALWIGIPAIIAFSIIYLFYISKGESPAQVSYGFKLTPETLAYPLASPILSGFSIDELFNGLVVPLGKPLFNSQWRDIILILVALLSIVLIIGIVRHVPNNNYRLFIISFYGSAVLFFGYSYWRQFDISMEPRHFRIIALLITPGVIHLVARAKLVYKFLFSLVLVGIAYNSFSYLIHGYKVNSVLAKGVTGIAQTNIDQISLNKIMKIDRENRNLTFVLFGDDIGLEILHNRILPLQPIGDDLKIDKGDYIYGGHAGPLYIVLPESYKGPKEKMIMTFFPGYKDFNQSRLSDKYVLFLAK